MKTRAGHPFGDELGHLLDVAGQGVIENEDLHGAGGH